MFFMFLWLNDLMFFMRLWLNDLMFFMLFWLVMNHEKLHILPQQSLKILIDVKLERVSISVFVFEF